MRDLTAIEEMRPDERSVWLRETWGLEIQYSNPEAAYPMDILRNGKQIGRIVRSGNLVVLELPGIDDLDSDKACGPDALEIWEYQGFEIGPAADLDAEHINAHIYYFVGTWAELQRLGGMYMKLSSLRADHYRSLRRQEIQLNDFNLFIGANASGKSTILDALRFLSEAVRARDFQEPVFARGGLLNLAWKGEPARRIELSIRLNDVGKEFDWVVRLGRSRSRTRSDFQVEEQLDELRSDSPPVRLLAADSGEGWWWSGDRGKVALKQSPTSCALAAASADASFPARGVAEFVGRWGFFDPSPFLLRRDWAGLESSRFDPYGRNLGGTLHTLHLTSPKKLERIVEITRAIVGLPSEVEPREAEDRFYFVQREPGLEFAVHQMGVSSGTLRILALITALHARPGANLIGIEEPENYIHPTALAAFLDHLRDVQDHIQFMVTTHSPLLLDFLNEPEAVRVVQRNTAEGTTVKDPINPERVRQALEASGFGLGEFYETKGFGNQ